MVGVARIELVTPAMSTRVAPANPLIFRVYDELDLTNENAIRQSFEFTLDQSNTAGA
jgi:hypothetical protein